MYAYAGLGDINTDYQNIKLGLNQADYPGAVLRALNNPVSPSDSILSTIQRGISTTAKTITGGGSVTDKLPIGIKEVPKPVTASMFQWIEDNPLMFLGGSLALILLMKRI